MKSRHLPYTKTFDDESSMWILVGRDAHGRDFGVGSAENIDEAERRLRSWVLDSLVAAAADGDDLTGDLTEGAAGNDQAITFGALDLLPVRVRRLRARQGLSQAQVAERLGMSQQAYAKLERPGANPELQTLLRIEQALEAELITLV
jgi:HTH-type transcriptional regulator / antitoxin HipB